MEKNYIHKFVWIIGGIVLVCIVLFAVFIFDDQRTPGISTFQSEKQLASSEPSMAPGFDMVDEDAGFVDGIAASRSMIAPDIFPQEFAPSDTTERLVIKTGSIGLVVDDVEESIKKLGSQMEDLGGFIISSNVYDIDLTPNGRLQVRVPAEKFNNAFDIIRKEGEIVSERISGRDVTEEFVDLEARLKNLKVTEEQFTKIMDQAVRIEDVLAVQRELSNVRAQIESMEGRRKFLEQSAKFSTISIDFSTDPEELPVLDDKDVWKPLAIVKNALRSLIVFGQGVINIVIWLAIYLPVWIVLGLLVWGIRRKVKRSKK